MSHERSMAENTSSNSYSAFDSWRYNSPNSPSRLERVRKRSENMTTKSPSTTGLPAHVLQNDCGTPPLDHMLSSSPSLPILKGSSATARSLMTDSPTNVWEEQGMRDEDRRAVTGSPAMSRSRSLLNKMRGRPKTGTLPM